MKFETIWFGSKFTKSNNSYKINHLKTYVLLLNLLLLVLIPLVAYTTFHNVNMASRISDIIATDKNNHTIKIGDADIKYENLSTKEINIVQRILKEIKPEYMAVTNKIVFVKDIKKHCGKDRYCSGVTYYQSKNIYIKYREDGFMREAICHELIHTLFLSPLGRGKENPIHAIIYDLGEKEVCFKEKERIIWMK